MSEENPFYYNLPTQPQDFTGRWALVDEIVEDLCRARADSWAVIGGRRFGKSSVLKAMEDRLTSRLAACDEGDRWVFPLIVDLKRCKPSSEEHIYACILHYLDRASRRSQIWTANNFNPIDLQEVATAGQNTLSFFQFEDTLEDLVQQMNDSLGLFRLILLLDEIESMMKFDWSETLLNQLRAMIYDGPLAGRIKLVLTGSANVIRARQAGSPLLNAVKIEHLPLLAENDLHSLIARGGEMTAEAAYIVKEQSGGHPFIAQYLLHHTWDNGLVHITPKLIEQTACQMRQNRSADLEGWWEAIGDSGRWAYAALTTAQDWVDEQELLGIIQRTEQSLDHGLSALCYHGLVKRDESLRHYRVAGKMFTDWFVLNGANRLAEADSQPEGAQIIIERLENYFGAQVNTGGGAYVKGSVNIEDGNFVGHDNHTTFDQRWQEVDGPQTNIAGNVQGPVLSGQFDGPVSTGGGEAIDMRGSQGAVYKPSGPVDQHSGDRVSIEGDGNVLGDNSRILSIEQTTEEFDLHKLRLDVAAPEQVFLGRVFEVAVSVRFPSSPKLTMDDLTSMRSGDVQVHWPEGVPYIQLRVCISAPECDFCKETSSSFRLYQEVDSPVFYFELIPKKLGPISIIVRVYQEENSLGSTRIRTEVFEEEVGAVKMMINSQAFQIPQGTQIFFGDFVAGSKSTDTDQRAQNVHGPQTNINDGVEGKVASGKFESATTFGDGDAKDCRPRDRSD